MKKASIAALCIIAGLVGYIELPRANTVQAATQRITATTADLQKAAAESQKKASALGTSIQQRETTTPERLREFTRTTERLTTMRERLRNDIANYRTASLTALVKFDKETRDIKDPMVVRDMADLRRVTEEDQTNREQKASDTIALLDEALAKGSDLQHAANCILIAKEVHDQGENLDTQIMTAGQSASAYQTTTNTLLAKITTELLAENRP